MPDNNSSNRIINSLETTYFNQCFLVDNTINLHKVLNNFSKITDLMLVMDLQSVQLLFCKVSKRLEGLETLETLNYNSYLVHLSENQIVLQSYRLLMHRIKIIVILSCWLISSSYFWYIKQEKPKSCEFLIRK